MYWFISISCFWVSPSSIIESSVVSSVHIQTMKHIIRGSLQHVGHNITADSWRQQTALRGVLSRKRSPYGAPRAIPFVKLSAINSVEIIQGCSIFKYCVI